MAIKNFTGGHYNRTFIDEKSGTKQQVFVGCPYIAPHGDYGTSDSYRGGVRLDTRGYDYMYYSMGNMKWRFFTIETDVALAAVRATLTAASISRGSLVSLRRTAGTTDGAQYGPREVKYWGSKATPAGGTQIVLERTMGRYPDPEFRLDWSWWSSYYTTATASKLTQANGTVFGTDIVLNRTPSGNLYTTDKDDGDCLNHASAANNWTLGQVNAFGRAYKGGSVIRLDPYIPYRQGWNFGDTANDGAGISGADTTFGMYHWDDSDQAQSYSNDSYLHGPRSGPPTDYDPTSGTYTGTSMSNMRSMYDDNWQGVGGSFYPAAVATTTGGLGPYNTAAGTWLGKVTDLPDALALVSFPQGTSNTLKTATTGWSTNGGYTSADTLALPAEDTNADGDTTDTGEAATTVVTGHNHLVEFDVWVTMHKRS